jgi:diguanylate cyclase
MPQLPPEKPPLWLPWLERLVLRLDVFKSTLLLTGVATLCAIVVSQLCISVVGHGNRVWAVAYATICGFIIAPFFSYACIRLVKHLDTEHARMRRLAIQDGLTGLFNRRHFLGVVEREWSRAQRYDTAAAMLLLDVDHFKTVNDRYGHLCGDAMLCAVADALEETLRQPDVLARFGGEEFIVFLPQTDPLGALDVAERMRLRIEQLQLPWEGQLVKVSISIGVAAMRPEHETLDHLSHDADVALYEAKAAGRNCVRSGQTLFDGARSVQNS